MKKEFRSSRGDIAFNIVNYTLLGFLGIITLYPFLYMLAVSLNDSMDTLKGGIWIFPREWTLQNFAEAFRDSRIVNAFLISVSRTVLGTAVAVVLTAMLAYGVLDKNLKGRRFALKFIFISTLFSGGIIPFFILMRDLNLIDSYMIYILPALYSFYNMIIVRAAFEAIPESFAEAATIDGAGELRILFQVYLPLSMPSLATVALFLGVFHWNDWFAGTFYVSSQNLKPAATLLQEIIASASSNSGNMNSTVIGSAAQNVTPQSLQMAFVIILVVPIVCVYPFLQKYFVKGTMIGGIKD